MLAHTSMAAAAAASASSLPLRFQIGKQSPFNLQFINHHQRAMKVVRMVVRAGGYTRVPLDTPGAYQLIDNETGEKFIILGGEENDPPNSPIPSQQVLSWKPFSSNSKRKGNSDSTNDSIGIQGWFFSFFEFWKFFVGQCPSINRKAYCFCTKLNVLV